jgi:hypothetical protein
MNIEEAWLAWMKATRKTDSPPTVEDFDVIKRSSHWAAFEAGCLMEREACAKLADSMRDKTSRYADYTGDVGEAIRSRTEAARKPTNAHDKMYSEVDLANAYQKGWNDAMLRRSLDFRARSNP